MKTSLHIASRVLRWCIVLAMVLQPLHGDMFHPREIAARCNSLEHVGDDCSHEKGYHAADPLQRVMPASLRFVPERSPTWLAALPEEGGVALRGPTAGSVVAIMAKSRRISSRHAYLMNSVFLI